MFTAMMEGFFSPLLIKFLKWNEKVFGVRLYDPNALF